MSSFTCNREGKQAECVVCGPSWHLLCTCLHVAKSTRCRGMENSKRQTLNLVWECPSPKPLTPFPVCRTGHVQLGVCTVGNPHFVVGQVARPSWALQGEFINAEVVGQLARPGWAASWAACSFQLQKGPDLTSNDGSTSRHTTPE
jgi:hypothetical protein